MPPMSLDLQIARVVDSGNCSGCGACCLLDSGLEMQLNDHGYVRPVRTGATSHGALQARFDRICPGSEVRAVHEPGAQRHPELGSALRSWQAWATDPEIRYRGSSGGVITALAHWLLAEGVVTEVIEATRSDLDPRRTVTVALRTPSGVIPASGSRYAPVSNAAHAVLGRPEVALLASPAKSLQFAPWPGRPVWRRRC